VAQPKDCSVKRDPPGKAQKTDLKLSASLNCFGNAAASEHGLSEIGIENFFFLA
jgi:hypothetical protein